MNFNEHGLQELRRALGALMNFDEELRRLRAGTSMNRNFSEQEL
jgi:hypothetical protein